MKKPYFSIVLPTYNRAHLLPKAIDSIIAQNIVDWELLLIDDGSIDNTKQVVQAYNDPRIRYYYQSNSGRSSARNLGLQNVKGRWICFLDSDDWYVADHLDVMKTGILKYPTDSIFKTGVNFVNSFGRRIFKSNFFSNSTSQLEFIIANYSSVLDLCIAQSLATSIVFPDIALWEDKVYIIDLLTENKITQIQKHTVIALEHAGRSILHFYKDMDSVNKTLDMMQDKLTSVGISKKKIVKTQQGLIFSVLIDARAAGIKGKNMKELFRKLSVKPSFMTKIRMWKRRLKNGESLEKP